MAAHPTRRPLAARRTFPILVAVLVLSGILTATSSATSTYAAFRVLGQADFESRASTSQNLSQPTGVHVTDSGHLLVADARNHRVLIWDSVPSIDGAPADLVLGQATLAGTLPNRGGSAGAGTLRCPTDVWSNGQTVIVADRGNNRVLIWDSLLSSPSRSSGASANRVLGQTSLDVGPSAPGDPCAPETAPPSSSNMARPQGVTSDGSRIFVSDTSNNRVLLWTTMTPSNGSPAETIIGQSGPTGSSANRGGAVGPDTLSTPVGLGLNGDWLYVVDAGNHRVLGFDSVPISTGASALFALGQPDLVSGEPDAGADAPSARSFDVPVDVSIGTDMLVVTDHFNHRALIFRPIPTSSFPAAIDEIGHGRFTNDDPGLGEGSFLGPWGVGVGSEILISDSGNNRALIFPTPLDASGASVSAIGTAGSRSIQLSWPPVSGASGYRIYRDGSWLADVVDGSITSYTDGGLSSDTYAYRVHALSDGNRVESGPIGTAAAGASGTAPPLVDAPTKDFRFYLAEGDSIAAAGAAPGFAAPEESYPLQLATYIRVPHFNASISGSSCADVAGRLGGELARYDPDLVTLGIGANDLSGGWVDTMGLISMSEYRQCLSSLIETIAPGPSRRLLLVNFTHQKNWDRTDPRFSADAPDVPDSAGSEEKRRAWNKVVRDVASDKGVALVDVASRFDALMQGGTEDFLLGDRVHLDQSGLDVVAEAVVEVLRALDGDGASLAPPGRPVPESDRVEPAPEGSTEVSFTWEPPSLALRPTDPYEVQWSPSRSFDPAAGVTTTYSSTAGITLPLPEDKIYVRVRAWTESGDVTAWSLWGRVRVGTPVPPDVTPPGPPGRPMASLGTGTNDPVWSWAPAADDRGVDKYMICFWLAHAPRIEDDAHCHYTSDTTFRLHRPFSGGVWYANVTVWDTSGNRGPYSELGAWFSAGLI